MEYFVEYFGIFSIMAYISNFDLEVALDYFNKNRCG